MTWQNYSENDEDGTSVESNNHKLAVLLRNVQDKLPNSPNCSPGKRRY